MYSVSWSLLVLSHYVSGDLEFNVIVVTVAAATCKSSSFCQSSSRSRSFFFTLTTKHVNMSLYRAQHLQWAQSTEYRRNTVKWSALKSCNVWHVYPTQQDRGCSTCFAIVKLSYGRPAWWVVGFSDRPLPCPFTVIAFLYFIWGTAAATPPPFRPSDPALCGSCPLVTSY